MKFVQFRIRSIILNHNYFVYDFVYNLGQKKLRKHFCVPLPPIFNIEECEKKTKSERASSFIRITYISTLNKGEKREPKISSQPFVQDCSSFSSDLSFDISSFTMSLYDVAMISMTMDLNFVGEFAIHNFNIKTYNLQFR